MKRQAGGWGLDKARLLVLAGLFGCSAVAQVPETLPAPPAGQTTPEENAPPTPARHGQIVIQSHGDAPSPVQAPSPAIPAEAVPAASQQPEADAVAAITDAERAALTIASYDLDLRLDLDRSGLEGRARLVVRNDGQSALRQLALQLSSTLQWQSATLVQGPQRTTLPLAQHRIDTDTDHTGAATEAVLTLPAPLAPGTAATLDLFYAGKVSQDGGRLARLGASGSQQRTADWDGIGPEWTGLRGFGDVLWYPVSSPQFFLADGNTLFTAIGHMRRHEEAANVQLRLTVTYTGEPPVGAYFCGRRADLKSLADDPGATTDTGLATATFAAEPLGFRIPSLFLVRRPEVLLGGAEAGSLPTTTGAVDGAGSSSSSSSFSPSTSNAAAVATEAASPTPLPEASAAEGPLLALATTDGGIAPALGAATDQAGSLLATWLGPRPLSALTVIDHEGQPYQDGPLLVAPAATLSTSPEQPALAYSLTHAWVQTGQPWIDEGLAQFFALLSVERDAGRAAAVAQLTQLLEPLAPVEPDLSAAGAKTGAGQPLTSASDELFYRRKAAAVWWMLRDIIGEKPLRQTLQVWRTQAPSSADPAVQALTLEHLLEKLSGTDLGWFFEDWVLRDRGLPDLSIAAVETSQAPAGPGHNTGWLVAVTVKNEGAAAAEVPVIVRSGQFSATKRLRIPGFAQATQRVLVESAPTEVVVNDGSTPEVRVATHLRQLTPETKAP